MYFWLHPVKTAWWSVRILLVICAIALLNFSAGYSFVRSVKTGEVHHLQLFGGFMPVHHQLTHEHPTGQVKVFSSQVHNNHASVIGYSQSIKIISSELCLFAKPASNLPLALQNSAVPPDPYLALPPIPPKNQSPNNHL
jgi:hypothetical protein